MTNTLPDFSERPELRPLAEVVRALREAGDVAETDCLLIGAAARDLWLRHGYGIEPGRETRDVDFGVAVADWAAFSALRRRLTDSGAFAPWPGAAMHRLRHRSGAPLDIVPFGGVERADRTIAWPPDGSEVFDCFGLREAMESSHRAVLSGGVGVRVAGIPALALLKTTAWHDRKHEGRDAQDLLLYLRKYIDCGQFDRAASEHADLFDDADFDYEVLSARLLGRHLAGLLDAAAIGQVLAILAPEADERGDVLLARQSGLEIRRACMLVRGVCRELEGALGTP
jgi:predicted nucleotidyltransferase